MRSIFFISPYNKYEKKMILNNNKKKEKFPHLHLWKKVFVFSFAVSLLIKKILGRIHIFRAPIFEKLWIRCCVLFFVKSENTINSMQKDIF